MTAGCSNFVFAFLINQKQANGQSGIHTVLKLASALKVTCQSFGAPEKPRAVATKNYKSYYKVRYVITIR